MSTPDTSPALDAPWLPTVDDVAALIRSRTKDGSGNEVGTFTAQTRPTDAEVEQLITNGCAKVASWVGWDLPPEAQDEANHLAAIVAACEAELSYKPEEVRSERSAFAQLWSIYQADIGPFAEYVSAIAAPGTVGANQGTIYTPSGTTVFAYQWGYGGWPMSDWVNV